MTTAKISHRAITRTRTKDSSSLLSTEYKERKERCFRKKSSFILACLEKKKIPAHIVGNQKNYRERTTRNKEEKALINSL